MNDRVQADLLDRIRNRFFGKYRGIVTEVDAATLRIKAKVPAVLGDAPTGWCDPCVPYAGDGVGFAFIPEANAGVWIEFEGGDVSYPIWSGCYWRHGEPPPDATPTVKAIVTGKLKIVFDTDAGSITITDAQSNTLTMDSSGITLKTSSQTLALADSSTTINNTSLSVSS